MSRTRNKIIRGALTAWQQDPRGSLDDVAVAAEVGRATVYRHFGSRAELIDALWRLSLDAFDSSLAEIQARGLGGLEALLALFDFAAEHGETSALLNTLGWADVATELQARYEESLRTMERWADEARHAGEISIDLPAPWIVRCHAGLIFAAWDGIATGHLAPLHVPRYLRQTFLQGIGPGPTPPRRSEPEAAAPPSIDGVTE